jgi:hypothetical protein
MQTHIRVLAVLQIAYASIALLLAVGAALVFGGIATLVGLNAGLAGSGPAIPLFAVLGSVAVTFLLLMSIPRFVAAYGLLNRRPWARTLTLVVSAVGALDFPVGTALGVYAFWVLTRRDWDVEMQEYQTARS